MTRPFSVEVSSAARRQLHLLPPKAAAAVMEFLTTVLPENPLRPSEPLTGALSGSRSARRGDYRVLIDVDEDDRRVLVVRIAYRAYAHRAYAYRPPSGD